METESKPKMLPEPRSLQEAIIYFANPDNCIDYLAIRRWPNGRVICPGCGSDKVSFNANRRTWKCSKHHSKREFSIKVGTVMEDSAIGLDKWLTAMWMILNCKNGVSSCEIAKDVRVTQKSAWFMLHRIRLSMQDETLGSKFSGEVEADETFIGGKARNMHKSVKARRITGQGRNTDDKIMVMGILERGGKIRTKIVADRKQETLHGAVRANVESGAELFTDTFGAYKGLESEFAHQVVDHALRYVDGRVHTNGLENFWSLLKRSLGGTYVSVEPFHLFRYLDEQSFRYNNRGTKENPITDSERFSIAASQLVGKRITFAQLTGKVGETIN
ncbi:MAG: IS1595 family transposase [Terriglobales bacterium]